MIIPTAAQVEAAAEAIANARAGRRGAPAITGILKVLPEKLKAEVMEDAAAALTAAQNLASGPDLVEALDEAEDALSWYSGEDGPVANRALEIIRPVLSRATGKDIMKLRGSKQAVLAGA